MSRRRILLSAAAFIVVVLIGMAGAFAGKSHVRQEGTVETTPAPEGTPVETLADCPWGDASCVLALGIERALQSGNVDAVLEFTAPRQYICPGGAASGAGGPFPLCDGVAKDEARQGIAIGRRYSEGSVVSLDALRDKLRRFLESADGGAKDAVGDGSLRLYAFSCSTPAIRFQNVSCAREGIILSAIIGEGAGKHRELLIFWAVAGLQGKTLPVAEVWDGVVMTDEVEVLFKSGGHLSDLGEVYAIDQSLRQVR